MATKFRLRRSATADKRPIESDLLLGELALNTYDGRLYTKRDTNNVGIADTAALLTPWTENFGGGSIHYSGNKKVGIGSEIPAKTLDVWNTSANADLRLKTTANSFNSFIFDSARQKDTQFAVIDGRWNGNVVNRIQFVTGSDDTNYDDGYMAFHTRKSGETLSERLRITSDGKVGIGTEVPDEFLHLGQVGTNGNNYNEGRLKIGGFQGTDKGLLIGYDNRGSGRANIVNANNSGGDANRINIGFGAITSSGTPTTEVVTINQDGKVGIGSVLPDYMLDVSGAINSETDVKVGGVSVSETALNDAVAMAIALG